MGARRATTENQLSAKWQSCGKLHLTGFARTFGQSSQLQSLLQLRQNVQQFQTNLGIFILNRLFSISACIFQQNKSFSCLKTKAKCYICYRTILATLYFKSHTQMACSALISLVVNVGYERQFWGIVCQLSGNQDSECLQQSLFIKPYLCRCSVVFITFAVLKHSHFFQLMRNV